jgi:cobalamin transport system substrate-binding protein
VGAETQAGQVVQQIRKTFEDARAHAPPERPKVLLVHNRGAGTLGSFYSVGRKAFQHDLIEIAGGQNLFADVDSETIQPTLEEVISRKPDIILKTLAPGANDSEVAQRKKDWEKLGLAKGRIYIERESYLLVPGPRLGLAATRISEIIRNSAERKRDSAQQ